MYGLQYWLPFMWQDQRKYANCQEWNNLTNIPPSYGWNTGVRFPETFPRLEYRLKGAYSDDPAMAEMGDSGSPRNLIYNNQLIAVSMISGPVLSTMVDLINAAIDTLGNNPNNYHCDVVDLTSWPEYTT
jgi:hypothetical protein